jgi:Uncharacterized protein conserved in bacteria (DUF2188)
VAAGTSSRKGHERASVHTDTKSEAIDRAREIIKNEGGGDLRIKNEQGRWIDSDTVAPGRESAVRTGGSPMQLDKQDVVDLLRKEGKNEHAQKALQELPDKIDHAQDAQMLQQKFGIDPGKLAEKATEKELH